eukprot:CAMPEP_0206218044 /NCGR_PEP_ID=MMETSP0047_2-20121206/3592_1 /ASSEMBLY_ACC=CAM_ASM_000192 /TAXON_ID=195065 /ORGANISM="Chroomonas mesostigmatica_cf, Strain CCMP1168" /LENGTH=190 /DNA_ID=CAMNT_0053640527 /DNA_START=107 /DNA_END=680 /DNA_ORIENTATION=+
MILRVVVCHKERGRQLVRHRIVVVVLVVVPDVVLRLLFGLEHHLPFLNLCKQLLVLDPHPEQDRDEDKGGEKAYPQGKPKPPPHDATPEHAPVPVPPRCRARCAALEPAGARGRQGGRCPCHNARGAPGDLRHEELEIACHVRSKGTDGNKVVPSSEGLHTKTDLENLALSSANMLFSLFGTHAFDEYVE